MSLASLEAINPYRPMPVQGLDADIPEHEINAVDADHQLLNAPTVQIHGELDLSGGWVLRRYVNPTGGDTISIYLERQKVARAVPENPIEDEATPEEALPHYPGYVYVLDDDEKPVESGKPPTTRELRAEARKQSQSKSKGKDAAPAPRHRPGRSTDRAIDGSHQKASQRLSVIPESPEDTERRVPDPGEAIAMMSGGLQNVPQGRDDQLDAQIHEQTRTAAPRPQMSTHPSSIPPNIAGLGAPRRPSQFMDGFKEHLVRHGGSARMLEEAAQTANAKGSAGSQAAGGAKRKSPGVQIDRERRRRRHASDVLYDRFLDEGEEGEEEEEEEAE